MFDRWNTARCRRLSSALLLGIAIASMGATASATVVLQPDAAEASSKGTAADAIGSASDGATQQSRWSWLIIAVLIGILLPALHGGREQGRAVQCLSNQRQIGMAQQFYADEFDEYIPSRLELRDGPELREWLSQLTGQANE